MGKYLRGSKRGIIGIEAAIVLIAFVIIAAAFAFMAINMGLFATQRSKDTIAQGLREASSPLQVDGSILIRVKPNELTVDSSIIPLRAMGVKYVPIGREETVVSLSIVDRAGNSKAFSNIYYGVVDANFDPTGKSFDELAEMANYFISGMREVGIHWASSKVTAIKVDDNVYEYTYESQYGFKNVTIIVQSLNTNVKRFDVTWGDVDASASDGVATLTISASDLSLGWNSWLLRVSQPGEYEVKIYVYDENNQARRPSLAGYGDLPNPYVGFRLYKVRNPLPAAVLIVDNSDGDEALDAAEKGFLIVLLGDDYKAMPRASVTIEVRVERSAPLTIEFMVPESLTENSWMIVAG